MPTIKICTICKKEYKCYPYRFDKSKYCSYECMGEGKKMLNSGINHSNWKTGKTKKSAGYVSIYCPEHPFAHENRVYEHRFVMENHIGRYLNSDEVVHHINGIKDDNRVCNLVILTKLQHGRIHKPKNDRWSSTYDFCIRCKKTDKRHNAKGLCTLCYKYVTTHSIASMRHP